MEGPDAGDVIANTPCRRKQVGEVSDVQANSGNVWIEEVEVITEPYEGLRLQGMVLGGTRAGSVLGKALSSLMKLRK